MNLMSQSKNGVINRLLVSKQFFEFLYSTLLYDSDSICTGKTAYLSVCLVMCVIIVIFSVLAICYGEVEWQVALGSTAVVIMGILLHKPQGTILGTFITDQLEPRIAGEQNQGGETQRLVSEVGSRWRWEELDTNKLM